MLYTGLAGDEQISTSSHLKEFHAAYGECSDPKTLYQLQTLFIRFAPIWPRITFLLESLVNIYYGLDESLFRFYDLYFTLNEYTPTKGAQLPSGAIPFLERPLGGSRAVDPFEYINSKATKTEKTYCLILVRWALNDVNATDAASFWYLEHAREVLEAARDQDRQMICAELMSEKTMKMISEVTVSADSGFWRVRKGIAERERALEDALRRVREALDGAERGARQAVPRTSTRPSPTEDVEYGASPILPANGYPEADLSTSDSRRSRVVFSPPSRSPSPSRARRGRFSPPLVHSHPHSHSTSSPWDDRRIRSHSRDSAFSAAPSASSIITWAPTEPDTFSLSMKIFSSSLSTWVESIGIMDTGCEGGNFISSAFLTDHLDMVAHIEADPDAEQMQFVDFGGKTDFKPLGKVKLKWYGREIQAGGGRKAKRSMQSESWFRVAPHLVTEEGEAPFQVLLGKDWLEQNEVLIYRGLRLFKRREKRTVEMDRVYEEEQGRRRALREEAEVERLADRLGSVSTNSGGQASPVLSASRPVLGGSPRSSAQSFASTSTSTSTGVSGQNGQNGQTNGVDNGVVAHVT